MKAISTLIIAAGLACSAPLALACGMKSGGAPGGWMLEQMDKNKDGAVSKKEFDTFHSERFKEMDANKDGKVTQGEMDALHQKMMDKCQPRFNDRFDEVDINHDGLLSKDEAEIGMPMLFSRFDATDTNKDGKISKEEMAENMKKVHEQMRDKGMMMQRAPQ